MSNNSSEPREWIREWVAERLCPDSNEFSLVDWPGNLSASYNGYLPDEVTLVEKEALTALQKENEQLKTQFHQLTVSHDALLVEAKEARSVIDFYADEDRWYVNGNPRLRNYIVDSDLSDVESMCGFGVTVFSCGGKRAREYQAKWVK